MRNYTEERKKELKEYRQLHYTGIYCSWYSMKKRCSNSNNSNYKYYGGRGIGFCEKWKTFEGFKEDMGKTYKEGLTLDRLDNSKDYSKENCRWATMKEQNNNKRNTVFLESNGIKRTLEEWANYSGIKFRTIRDRYYRGLKTEQILEPLLWKKN